MGAPFYEMPLIPINDIPQTRGFAFFQACSSYEDGLAFLVRHCSEDTKLTSISHGKHKNVFPCEEISFHLLPRHLLLEFHPVLILSQCLPHHLIAADGDDFPPLT